MAVRNPLSLFHHWMLHKKRKKTRGISPSFDQSLMYNMKRESSHSRLYLHGQCLGRGQHKAVVLMMVWWRPEPSISGCGVGGWEGSNHFSPLRVGPPQARRAIGNVAWKGITRNIAADQENRWHCLQDYRNSNSSVYTEFKTNWLLHYHSTLGKIGSSYCMFPVFQGWN